jgi:hypothetical protein
VTYERWRAEFRRLSAEMIGCYDRLGHRRARKVIEAWEAIKHDHPDHWTTYRCWLGSSHQYPSES